MYRSEKFRGTNIEPTLTISRYLKDLQYKRAQRGNRENLGEKNDLELEIESFAMQYIKRGYVGKHGKNNLGLCVLSSRNDHRLSYRDLLLVLLVYFIGYKVYTLKLEEENSSFWL